MSGYSFHDASLAHATGFIVLKLDCGKLSGQKAVEPPYRG